MNQDFPPSRTALHLRLAALASITSGLIGGLVWFVDLADRGDGDSLRWGFWHNPLMQFPPFNEPFLDLSMWILLACSAAAGLGGLILLGPRKWGVPLVTWQARVSITINTVTAFYIAVTMFAFANREWGEFSLIDTPTALLLRLGAIAVDLVLLTFLTSTTVREFFIHQSHPAGRAFEVITKTPVDQVPMS